MRKMWRLFGANVFEKFVNVQERPSAAAELATILRHNLELLGDPAGSLRARDVAEIELEALRVEVLEAHETIATLVEELNLSRMWAEHLEGRLADYEDDKVVPLRRGRPRP
jgi:hypothetical protein